MEIAPEHLPFILKVWFSYILKIKTDLKPLLPPMIHERKRISEKLKSFFIVSIIVLAIITVGYIDKDTEHTEALYCKSVVDLQICSSK